MIDPNDTRHYIPDEDTGDLLIRIRMNGDLESWTVHAPNLGTLRDLDLLAAKLDREGTAKLEAAAAAVAPDEVPEDVAQALAQPALHDQVAVVFPWWRLLFERCADRPLPDDDDCPLWMGTSMMLARTIAHWQLYPFRALGSGGLPMMEALQTVQSMLTPGETLPTGSVVSRPS